MAEVTFDELTQAVVDRIAEYVTALNGNVTYLAPEKPPAALMAWVEIGPTEYELGNLEIALHTVNVTVAVPAGVGGYKGQNTAVHATAFQCLKAFRGDTLVADEAPVAVAPAVIGKPFTGQIGGSQKEMLVVACQLTFTLETLDAVVDQIEE